MEEAYLLRQSEDGGALPRQLYGFPREVHCCDARTGACEVNGVRADATANFQDLLVAPAIEFGETRNVIFHEVFASFDVVEVFLRAHRLRRMPDVARPSVPVFL